MKVILEYELDRSYFLKEYFEETEKEYVGTKTNY